MSQSDFNQSHASSHSMVFDPFKIAPNHRSHAESTSIIVLEESGKIFCPLCLKESSTNELGNVESSLFEQYMKNMFEALDQHSERTELRKIVLQILNIILEKRPIIIKSDHEYYNILRIFYKIMKSDKFSSDEFPGIVNIFANISTSFVGSNPIPILAVWKASLHMLNYGKNKLESLMLDSDEVLSHKSCKIISSVAIIIKSYLEIVRRFSKEQSSHSMFSLIKDIDGRAVRPESYVEGQIYCLNLVIQTLLPMCCGFLAGITRSLQAHEQNMVASFFRSLTESLNASMRLDNDDLMNCLIDNDILFTSHLMIYRNSDSDFRLPIRLFLSVLVHQNIQKYFGFDERSKRIITSSDNVETNHKNAVVFSRDPNRYKRTVFYILLNSVAMMHKSKYFNQQRVLKVVKAVDPEQLRLRESKVLMRSYLYAAANVTDQVIKLENVLYFIKKTWRQLRDGTQYDLFSELFCFDENILRWSHEHPDFVRLVTPKIVKYILGWSIKKGLLLENFTLLMKNKYYKNVMNRYLKNEESAIEAIREVVEFDKNPVTNQVRLHCSLMDQLSPILMALFQSSILNILNSSGVTAHPKLQRIVNIIVTLMRGCDHFSFFLDEQFIDDMFKMMEILYSDTSSSQETDDTLIMINEFIIELMETNSPHLMIVLKKLDFSILGYMYHRIADYTLGDDLAESIASLLVVYDRIDYPLVQNIGRSLNTMALSVVNWMLSQNDNLHILSLLIAQNILITDMDEPTRACVSTGLIHMLSENPKILEQRIYLNKFLSIVGNNAFKYNPLIDHLLSIESVSIREEIMKRLYNTDKRPPSPAMSFSSCGSDLFEEQRCSVSQILTQLNESESSISSSHRIPETLYVAGTLKDQHLNSNNTDDWERRAYDTNKNAEAF